MLVRATATSHASSHHLQEGAQPRSDRVALVGPLACVAPNSNLYQLSAGLRPVRADLAHDRHLDGHHSWSGHSQRLAIVFRPGKMDIDGR